MSKSTEEAMIKAIKYDAEQTRKYKEWDDDDAPSKQGSKLWLAGVPLVILAIAGAIFFITMIVKMLIGG